MVVRGDGGRGTRDEGHIALLPSLPHSYLPMFIPPHAHLYPPVPVLASCSFIHPCTHSFPHTCSYHPCSFVPPTLICTPVATVPACHRHPYHCYCCCCGCCWCLIHHLSPPASWFTCTRWFMFVFAFVGPGSNSLPLLAGSWFIFIASPSHWPPGSHALAGSHLHLLPLLLLALGLLLLPWVQPPCLGFVSNSTRGVLRGEKIM